MNGGTVPCVRAFSWFELRTTAPRAACGFYKEALGFVVDAVDGQVALYAGGEAFGEVSELPAQAAARGAPAHWLGHVGVDDVAAALQWFLARGASQLGPTRARADGSSVAAVRDPFGAVLALSSRTRPPPGAVVWCDLHVHDAGSSAAFYCEAFAWAPGRARAHESLTLQEFAWTPGGPAVGATSSAARRSGVHTHWLFHFRVADIHAAAARVRAHGGRSVGDPVRVREDAWSVVCEDPQGAAFAMRGPG